MVPKKKKIHILHVVALNWTVDNSNVCCVCFNVTGLPFVLCFAIAQGLQLKIFRRQPRLISFNLPPMDPSSNGSSKQANGLDRGIVAFHSIKHYFSVS